MSAKDAEAPLVSVVIPFRDRAAYLEHCIEGLLAQTLPADRFEIIMVENGSSDGSVAVVRRYPRVRLLDERRPGAYAARNRGVREARSSLIAFTDADCVPEPDWLERIVAAMQDPAVAVVQGDRVYRGRSRILEAVAAYESEKNGFIFGSASAERYHAYANNMAVRRELFGELGPFPEMARGADVVFLQRVLKSRGPGAVRFCPEARVAHLEITGLRSWLRKMFIYGKSYEHYSKVEPCRPLDHGERLSIVRRVVRREGTSALSALLLAVVLLPGGICYAAGRWAGRRSHRR